MSREKARSTSGHEEQPVFTLYNLILLAFNELFGGAIVRVGLTPAVHECWVQFGRNSQLPVSWNAAHSFAPKRKKEKLLVYIGGISKLRGAMEMVRALDYLAHVESLRLNLIGRFKPSCSEKATGFAWI